MADRVFYASAKLSLEDIIRKSKNLIEYPRTVFFLTMFYGLFLMIAINRLPWIYVITLGLLFPTIVIGIILLYHTYYGESYTLKKDILVIERHGKHKSIRYSEIKRVIEAPYIPPTIPPTTKKSRANENEVEIRFIDNAGKEISTIVSPHEKMLFLSMLRGKISEAKRVPAEGK